MNKRKRKKALKKYFSQFTETLRNSLYECLINGGAKSEDEKIVLLKNVLTDFVRENMTYTFKASHNGIFVNVESNILQDREDRASPSILIKKRFYL